MGAALEVDFVADINPQTDGPEISLDAATRIDDTNHVIGAKTANRARKRRKSNRSRRKHEIVAATFYSNKGPEGSATGLKLRTDHAMQNPQP